MNQSPTAPQYHDGASPMRYHVRPSRRVPPCGSGTSLNSPRSDVIHPSTCGGCTAAYGESSRNAFGCATTSKASRRAGSHAVIGSMKGPVVNSQ